jgi:hypothetical protein
MFAHHIIISYRNGTGLSQLNYETGIPISKIKEILVNSGTVLRNTIKSSGVSTVGKDNIKGAIGRRRIFFASDKWSDFSTFEENEYYFIGWVASDGSVGKSGLVIAIQEGDLETLKNLSDIAGSTRPIHRYEYKEGCIPASINGRVLKSNPRVTLAITEKHIVEDFRKMGFSNNKSYDLKWPTWIPEQYERDFLRGFFEGDGSVYRDKKGNLHIGFTGTKDILDGVSRCLSKIGINHKPTIVKGFEFYRMRFGGNTQAKKFLDFIYYDGVKFPMERKVKFLKQENERLEEGLKLKEFAFRALG